MQKRYWLRGGVVGIVLVVVLIIFGFTQSGCVGLYLNRDGTMGTNCPTSLSGIFLQNLMTMPTIGYLYLLGMILVAFVIFAFIGLMYGKIKNRKQKPA